MKKYIVTVDDDQIISWEPYVFEAVKEQAVKKEEPIYVDYHVDCSDKNKNGLAVFHECLKNLPKDRAGVTKLDVSIALRAAIKEVGVRHGGPLRPDYRTTVFDNVTRGIDIKNKKELDNIFYDYYVNKDDKLKDKLLDNPVKGKEQGDEIMIEYAFEEFDRMYF